jgi:hypothetical protein
MRFLRKLALAVGAAGLLWSGLLGGALANATTMVASAANANQAHNLLACVKAAQGAAHHAMTLAEARSCEQGIPEVQRAAVPAASSLPSLYLVVDGTRAILSGNGPAQSDPSNAAYAGCYNTWTNPRPWSSDGVSFVQLNAYGYGNHCNYANVPSNPTVTVNCVCLGFDYTVGHWDSVWGRNNIGLNSAAGWTNITIHMPFGTVTWFCRGYVNTNGAQSPGGYCLP